MTDTYHSPLRRRQKDRTRQNILEALVQVMASGVADLSIPAVARQAKVAVPTVYRHFPNKKALLAALAPHVERMGGAGEIPTPTTPEELAGSTHQLFGRLAAYDAATRAAMASRLGKRFRRETLIERRRAMIEAALAPALRARPRDERILLVNVILVLWSSATLQAMKDYLGLDAAMAAKHVAWAITALTRSRA